MQSPYNMCYVLGRHESRFEEVRWGKYAQTDTVTTVNTRQTFQRAKS